MSFVTDLGWAALPAQTLDVEHGGALVGSRDTLNLIDGANVTLTVADNPGSDRVDATVAAAGGGIPTFSGCGVTRTANKVIAAATDTAVDWNAEDYDTDAYHDNATNNTRLTAPTTGYYLCVGGATRTGTGEVAAYIRKNGNTALRFGFFQVTANTAGVSSLAVVQLNATDYVELMVFASAGLTLDCTGNAKSRFQISRLGG